MQEINNEDEDEIAYNAPTMYKAELKIYILIFLENTN